MNKLLKKFYSLLKTKGRASKDYVVFKGLNLPIIRSNEKLDKEEDYITSIVQQIDFLKHHELINKNSEILDFGCGQGRLINGLVYSKTEFGKYMGIDTSSRAINWCLSNLLYNEKINFTHLPAYNARYNNQVEGLKEIPFSSESFDLIFLNSVFSHMLSKDIIFYLNEFYHCLKVDGYVYITAFVEENVPDEAENPENYLAKSTGALHRVRFNKDYIFKLIADSGFEVFKFYHQNIIRTKQSVIVLKKAKN